MSESVDLGRFTTRRRFGSDDVDHVLRLHANGTSDQHISRMTGLPEPEVRRVTALTPKGVRSTKAPDTEKIDQAAANLLVLAFHLLAMSRRLETTTPAAIIAAVAQRHKLCVEDLEGPRRSRKIAWPRQEAMAELYARTSLSLPAIGRRLGGRDHTTVLYGIKRHMARVAAQREVVAA